MGVNKDPAGNLPIPVSTLPIFVSGVVDLSSYIGPVHHAPIRDLHNRPFHAGYDARPIGVSDANSLQYCG